MYKADRLAVAIDDVARRIAANSIRACEPDWREYAYFGEDDWTRIVQAVEALAEEWDVPRLAFRASYEYLESRAYQ